MDNDTLTLSGSMHYPADPSEAYFDRFDICAAYQKLEADYNVGGWLRERPSNIRRMESIGVQLHRMEYHSGMGDGMTDNARNIYEAARIRLGLPA